MPASGAAAGLARAPTSSQTFQEQVRCWQVFDISVIYMCYPILWKDNVHLTEGSAIKEASQLHPLASFCPCRNIAIHHGGFLQELHAQRFLMEEVAPKLGVSKNAVKTMVLRSTSGGSEAIGAAIDEYARNVGAMMVLMTRHAKPQLQEMFTGSVTVSCVKKCTVPLTIVH